MKGFFSKKIVRNHFHRSVEHRIAGKLVAKAKPQLGPPMTLSPVSNLYSSKKMEHINCENDIDSAVFLSQSADGELFAQLWKTTAKLETDNTHEETHTQLNTMLCTDTKSNVRVLRCLSPGTLQSMSRWVFATS